MKNRKNRKGFTLVELVIVIGVIGILAGILIPTFVNVTSKANEAALKSNLANAYSAYAADAADGTIDGTSTAITFYGQSEVALAQANDATSGYKFVNSAWTVEVATFSGSLVADKAYGGYYVFHLA